MRLGVCYYPEHWPADAWAEDARRMVEMGLSLVRIGEFCWSRVEPVRGRFEWDWLDRAVATLADAGLRIVMCTPTATPPKWLIDRHPGILPIGSDGRPRGFGSRRHYDFSSDVWLAQARRITTHFAERYGRHPAVVAWQTDNEYGCHDTVLSHSPAAVQRFRVWLRERYGSVGRLNEAWGNVFWSMEYASFDEIDAPAGAVTETNPAHRLDFRRFASGEVVRFNRMQCEILRRHSPGRAITHNFMQFFTEFDHHAVARDLDAVAWDSYPTGALENFPFPLEEKHRWLRTGHPDFAAFHHDLYRGMSRQPFWVMEQQAGPVTWGRWNVAPERGMVRLWTWEAFAHGADVVSYFRWRQVPFGQEQMYGGLHRPDRSPDVGAAEVAQVAQELARVPAAASRPARVALLFSYDARWATEVQPHGSDIDALWTVFGAYAALRSLGLDVDIVSPRASLAGHALVVVPSLPIVPPGLVDELQAGSAQVVFYARCGSKIEPLRIPADLPPGELRQLVNLRVTRVESLRPTVREPVAYAGQTHACVQWREHVEAGEGAHAEAHFGDGGAAVVRQGRVRYLAGTFEPAMMTRLLGRAAADAGLELRPMPEGLRLRRRGDLCFAINYGDTAQHVDLPRAQWLLGDAVVPARGVAVAKV